MLALINALSFQIAEETTTFPGTTVLSHVHFLLPQRPPTFNEK